MDFNYSDAVKKGDISCLYSLSNKDCNELIYGDYTLLHHAIINEKPDIARFLIDDKCVDVNSRSTGNETPLHLSVNAREKSNELLSLLLSRGADPDLRDRAGDTPLHWLNHIKKTDDEIRKIVSLLISHKADINARNKFKETPLFRAFLNNNFSFFSCLLEQGANIDARDSNGYSLLHLNSYQGDKRNVQFLLYLGADVNLRTTGNYNKMLSSHKELSSGAEIDMIAIKHDELKTALHLAIEWNHKDVVKVLLDRSPEVDAKDSSGLTPLHYAISKGYFDIAIMLLNRGANINSPSGRRGNTLLHYHTKKDNIDVVEFLLDHNANANILNKKMKTPMYYAIYNGNPEIISLLNSASGIPEFITSPDEQD